MTMHKTDDPVESDDELKTDYFKSIIEGLKKHQIALIDFDIGRINRKLNFYVQDNCLKTEARLRAEAAKMSESLAALNNALHKFRHEFNRQMSNPYTRDRMIRAYCGSDAFPCLTETDKNIDRLGKLEDLAPLESAIEKAMNDSSTNSPLPIFKAGRQFRDQEHKLAKELLGIINEGIERVAAMNPPPENRGRPPDFSESSTAKLKGAVKNDGTPQNMDISHGARLSLISQLLTLVSIEIGTKALHNRFPASH